ncbi:DedA family protein [Ruminiclostridium cellobioparum]|jgi:membrane-associated protein|uniref:Putative membrane-associated protein n=1 Tax=Ruminiclostridium cellobioparum subsp. termitidis CT1112 TaxID=1195236 RepID=S0FXK1_RUMCE|nr:DedA family protein [Ruminiclostridium cellobioparum]EMS73839.1 putative membrane-associated protein [Ruminiclostridium cellobioparum subsp. termitidis CT1112]
MNLIFQFIDFVVHLDVHLTQVARDFGMWTYLFLFLVIFCETGLVFTPFLPGDSMIFVIGNLAKSGELNFPAIIAVLMVAAVLGDTCNYHIGKFFGLKLFSKDNARFLKKEYLIKTQNFYEKYGGKTIIIARFIPIIRTFAPFVAGMGSMNYSKFLSYNVIGGISWVALFSFAGFFFGKIPFVENNFSVVILAIIFISLLPGVITFLRERKSSPAK